MMIKLRWSVSLIVFTPALIFGFSKWDPPIGAGKPLLPKSDKESNALIDICGKNPKAFWEKIYGAGNPKLKDMPTNWSGFDGDPDSYCLNQYAELREQDPEAKAQDEKLEKQIEELVNKSDGSAGYQSFINAATKYGEADEKRRAGKIRLPNNADEEKEFEQAKTPVDFFRKVWGPDWKSANIEEKNSWKQYLDGADTKVTDIERDVMRHAWRVKKYHGYSVPDYMAPRTSEGWTDFSDEEKNPREGVPR